MLYDPPDPFQELRGIVEGNAGPDVLRSREAAPAALDRYRLAGVSALRADPAFKGVLERVRNAGAKQIADRASLAQTSRFAVAIGDIRFEEGSGSTSTLTPLTLEKQKDLGGTFQQEDGVHQVRIVLEEFEAESDVWADPVIAVGQFVLMLAEDYGYWLRLLEEAGCGAG